MLTHAARAAAKQPPLVAARDAREGLWLEQDDIGLPISVFISIAESTV